ncbi:MAG TPA: hypothetical protein VH088_16730 [Terriglobales bacterium]|nr:hypothetical protein [Terriglobales bacterium]
MTKTIFEGRRALQLENEFLRVTVLEEGGHIAEVFDKRAGLSPLWVPPWPSIEPSSFSPEKHPQFGSGPDAKLLAGIMGHNLCLDLFGVPSPEEALAGLTVHGEASVDRYAITETPSGLLLQLMLPLAQLKFSRSVTVHGQHVRIHEVIENLSAEDRPLGWTQHVTLGPPFLDPATTQFRASLTRSMVSEGDPGSHAYLSLGREFQWPIAPRSDSSTADMRQMNETAPASSYTAHIADPQREHAFFVAFAPQFRLAFGYVWKRADFPWLGIWEENCSRAASPWDGRTVTRGMEFGVSPFPETRRKMVERNRLMGMPTYKWIPCRGRLEAEYWIVSQPADVVPETLAWPRV